MTNLLHEIKENGGFSLSPFAESPKSGYMVSLPDYETVIPLALLDSPMVETIYSAYSQKIEKNSQFVGAWVDGQKVYFDLSENYTDKETAVKVAIERAQLGIFDLSSFETIRL